MRLGKKLWVDDSVFLSIALRFSFLAWVSLRFSFLAWVSLEDDTTRILELLKLRIRRVNHDERVPARMLIHSSLLSPL